MVITLKHSVYILCGKLLINFSSGLLAIRFLAVRISGLRTIVGDVCVHNSLPHIILQR